jgi:hypothetical protein
VPRPGELVDFDEDGGESPPELEDPGRPFRRLIQAILLASLQDYVGSQDFDKPSLKQDASCFPRATTRKSIWRACWNVLGWMRDGSANGASNYG